MRIPPPDQHPLYGFPDRSPLVTKNSTVMITQFNLTEKTQTYTFKRSEKWDYARREWVPSHTCTNRSTGRTVIVTAAYYEQALAKFRVQLEKTKLPKL